MAIFDDLPYRTYDVLIMEPNQIENGDTSYDRRMEEHDNLVSLPHITDTADESFPTQKFLWLLANRKEKIDFYRFIYRIRGRQKMMWVPTHLDDIRMVLDAAPEAATLTIENIGLSTVGIGTRQRHLMFRRVDGTYAYRRIENAAWVSSKRETITLDRGFYDGLNRSAIDMISFIALARLDNDSIEIRHQGDMDGVATSATVFKTIWDIRDV